VVVAAYLVCGWLAFVARLVRGVRVWLLCVHPIYCFYLSRRLRAAVLCCGVQGLNPGR
jgi:hypothetical protein